MTPILLVIIAFGVIFTFTAAFAQGLSSTVDTLRAGFKGRSQSTVLLLIAKMIVIPFLTIGLAVLLPFEPQIKMAVCVVALTAGAPFIPWVTSLGKGNLSFSASASMLLTILTFILLPFTLPLALNLLGTGADVSPWLVAWPMILFMVIPLAMGMLIRARYPKLAQEIGPYLGPLAITALFVHITLFLTATWSDVTAQIFTGVFVFAFVMPLLWLLTGRVSSPPYLLNTAPVANPHRGAQIVSGVSCALSNTGATICCAIFALGKYTVAGDGILVFGLVAIIVTVLIMAELGKRYEKAEAAATPAQPSLEASAGKPSN